MKNSALPPGVTQGQRLHRGSPLSPEEQILRAQYPNEFAAYQYVKSRCNRGRAQLDPRWTDFANFVSDMGRRPSTNHTISLIEPTVERFGPATVKWMSRKELSDRKRAATPPNGEQDVTHFLGELLKAAAEAKTGVGSPRDVDTGMLGTWRYQGAEPIAQFNIRFRLWRAKVDPRLTALALPEVYYYLSRSLDLIVVSQITSTAGEFSPTLDAPGPSAVNGRSRLTKKQASMTSALNSALNAIASKSPHLAAILQAAQAREDSRTLQGIMGALVGKPSAIT